MFDLVKRFGGLKPTGLSIHIAREVILGVRDLHARSIAHRDLKLEVLRLGPSFECVVSGLVHCLPSHAADGSRFLTELRTGTSAYAAPEALAKEEHESSKTDMWSLGVLLFILVVGRPPLRRAEPGDRHFEIFKTRARGDLDELWSRHLRASRIPIDQNSVNFRDLIERLLRVDPARRPTILEVMRHPWICTTCPTKDICRRQLAKMHHAAVQQSEEQSVRCDPEMGIVIAVGGRGASGGGGDGGDGVDA